MDEELSLMPQAVPEAERRTVLRSHIKVRPAFKLLSTPTSHPSREAHLLTDTLSRTHPPSCPPNRVIPSTHTKPPPRAWRTTWTACCWPPSLLMSSRTTS